ncbi:MAG: AI-2E family transporter [Clostridia bacterium]|nr:AI-2E family transporter [Clostridia bacterium]
MEDKMKESIRKYAGLAICLFSLFLAITYWEAAAGFLALLLGAARPLILGGVIAYIVNLLMRLYEDKLLGRVKGKTALALRRPLCILLALASVALLLVVLVWMILPELWASIQLLVSEVPGLLQKGVALLEEKFGFDWAFLDTYFAKLQSLDWESIAKNLFQGLGSAVGTAVSVVGTMAGVVIDFVVALVFAIYLLAGKEGLGRSCFRLMDAYLKPRTRDRILYVVRTFDNSFSKFIVGQCVEAVILGVLCIVGMALLGIPYATMVGTLVGFTALIPVAGAYIGGVVGFLLIATVSPVKAILFVVFLVVLQQLEGNLIYPRVVGSSIGLPGIWVLAAITVGGGVMGVLGMLLGVPLFAGIYQILRDDLRRRERMEPMREEEAEIILPDSSLILPEKEIILPKAAQQKKKKKKK